MKGENVQDLDNNPKDHIDFDAKTYDLAEFGILEKDQNPEGEDAANVSKISKIDFNLSCEHS